MVASIMCLRLKETTPLEPGVEEHKFFASGVGDIKEQLVSGGSEILELTKIRHNKKEEAKKSEGGMDWIYAVIST